MMLWSKTLLQQGSSEPVFYGDLDFKMIIKRYILRYNMDIMQQSVCMVINQMTVYRYGLLFNYTMVDQA